MTWMKNKFHCNRKQEDRIIDLPAIFMLSLIVLSQTLKPAPTKLGDFLGQTLLTAPTKVWETPLNFDDPKSRGNVII